MRTDGNGWERYKPKRKEQELYSQQLYWSENIQHKRKPGTWVTTTRYEKGRYVCECFFGKWFFYFCLFFFSQQLNTNQIPIAAVVYSLLTIVSHISHDVFCWFILLTQFRWQWMDVRLFYQLANLWAYAKTESVMTVISKRPASLTLFRCSWVKKSSLINRPM